ncbi:hypothetical protein [Sphingobacterium sp. GVS05A]|nr:hypothetical protein [Sphingobacterium sp. GVS05A]
MESTNDQILKGMEMNLGSTQLLSWEQLLPFIAEQALSGDRCPIFTI